MTWNEYLSLAERKLTEAGVEDARTNVEYLAAHILGYKNRSDLRKNLDLDVLNKEVNAFESLLERRTAREPLQYILGEWEFYGIPIKLNSSVLIPRPETEILVEQALEEAKRYSGSISILDIGTGSGCIAIALAKHLPRATIVGIDISENAIDAATQNARFNSIANIHFRTSDIFSIEWNESVPKFDLIVSNPPYVSQKDFELLEPELRLYEPRMALTDNADGLSFYMRIAEVAPSLLLKDGRLIIELGYNSDSEAGAIMMSHGLEVVKVMNDLAGIPRVLIAKLSN